MIAPPGYKIGFDVGISDNDGTVYRKNQHLLAGFNQNQSWWDMGAIGALIWGKKEGNPIQTFREEDHPFRQARYRQVG